MTDMPPIYNTTNLTSATDMVSWTQELNLLSDQWIGMMIFLAILIVIFGSVRARSQAPTTNIFAFVTWFGAVLSVPAAAIKFIPPEFVVIMIMFSVLALGVLWLSGRPD